MVKSLAKAAFKTVTKGLTKEALPVIGKEVAEQTFKNLDVTAKEALGNLGRHKTYQNLALESQQSFSNHFEKLPFKEIPPEYKAIDSIFQKIEGTDPELQNIGWEELNDVDHAFRAVNHTSHETTKLLAKKAEVRGKPPLAEPGKAYQLSEGVEDFMGDTDLPTARAWETPGGELDQALEDMLTVKKKTTITTPEGKKVTLNKGDKMTPDMLTGTKLDYYNSLVATGHQTSPDDILTYGPWDVKQKSKMAHLEGVDPEFSPQLHKGKTFHHKAMKEVQSTIHKRARQLREAGEATTDDLINLHALSNTRGAPSGSRAKAGLWMEEFGHSFGHKKISQPKGIEPTTTKWTNEPLRKGKSGKPLKPPEITPEVFAAALKAADELEVPLTRYDLTYIQSWSTAKDGLSNAIAKWKVLRKNERLYKLLGPDGESEMSRLMKSTQNMNIAELTQFQKEVLEDITLPMTEEMVLMEEVMDLLTGTELIKLQKTKDWDSLSNLRRALKDKKAALKQAKIDKKERKFESAIEAYY